MQGKQADFPHNATVQLIIAGTKIKEEVGSGEWGWVFI